MDLQFNRIQHIGLPVSNLQVSETFYRRLGFDAVMRSDFLIGGEQGRVTMVKKGEIVLELYQLPDSHLEEIRHRKDGHIDHVAFDVDDIRVAFDHLRRLSFDIVEKEPVFLNFWDHGCWYFKITGPDGECLEFNEIVKAPAKDRFG